ncbi:MAG: Peptidase C60, sortase A and B [Microgenomates group bacterium Gr01-1014_7]|nr:MAG: Peptidase C60, sortase A and B [Microgenomates group bacterium Gr01-1014_7]
MSKRYKLVFLIRFFGYLIFFTGLLSFIFVLGPVVSAEVNYRIDRVFGVKHQIAASTSKESKSTFEVSPGPGFGSVQAQENTIIPVSTEYGIVIEKINANSKVIAGVNPANEREYTGALSQGVAEALGSTLPGQPGNLYLFSHSTDAPWNIIRYNATFYLLRELEPGDRVIIFYRNIRYDYVVFDKTIAAPTDISFLTNRYETPVLTLQTCDPPGTLLNRLVVRAKLVSS